MDLQNLFENVDSRITSSPNSTLRSLAQELNATVRDIEKAVREVDGVSFREYKENKRLAHALKALEEERSPAGSRIHQIERVQPRLNVAGATVRYLLQGSGIYKSEFSSPYPIVDLSTAGMAFLAERPAKPGRKVCLLASLSKQKEPLRLEGHIVYAVAVDIAGHKYRLGIRFQPFSAQRGCNPQQALEDLTQIIKAAVP
jgi:hypothetical protein